MLDLATMLRVAEQAATRLHTSNKRISRAEVHAEIKEILWKLCDILAYRVSGAKKGATFLVLNNAVQTFSLYCQVRHDDQSIAAEISSKLTINKGLAAQAARENRTFTIRDCKHPPKGIDWVNTHDPPRYRGRTAAPVQFYENNDLKVIGVLCFDIKIPWKLTQEELNILTLASDTIATLWQISQ